MSSAASPRRWLGHRPGATFKRPWAFWLGVSSVTAGVLLHVPMYLDARADHYMLRGMPFDIWMKIGMVLIVGGYAGVVFGLAPRFRQGAASGSSELKLSALDSSRLSPAHIRLMLVLMLGIAIDTQKPFTFTFILPGVADEYNLQSASHPAPGHWPVALFPFVAIVGTVLGSLLWGYLGDRIGRRASILLAAALFIGTAMCSAMPEFWQNLIACLVMGMSAGGLLPIVYSLLAETIPARRRGEVVVLVAGVGTAAGFLLASWTAHWLIPTYGWRIMWFFGIPTGLALIALNRYIPESPRFLLANGHREEAHEIMRSFGIVVTEREAGEQLPAPSEPRAGFASVFRRPHRGISLVLTLDGLAWGLVNFGFLVWLPIHVAKSGVSAGQVTTILAKAALFAIPGSILISQLDARWSSRGTLVAAAALEAITLGVFATAGDSVVRHSTLFTALIVILLVSMWATISALGLSVAAIAPPSLAGAALLAAVPAGLAAVMLGIFGIETRGRQLEEISAPALDQRLEPVPR